jgi:dihydroorotase-like cyclic amidohydrolase
MGFDTIITGGTVVTAADTSQADVAITGGRVVALGSSLPRENATRLIDAAGKYVFPGGIDVHTHLDMPFGGTTSADDFETGTRAAAFGGTTTLIDFAIQYKGQSLRTAFDAWMQKASSKAVADYGFHCIITDLPDARNWRKCRNWCAKASAASNCSWPTPAFSCSTTPAFSKPCGPSAAAGLWSACTRKWRRH